MLNLRARSRPPAPLLATLFVLGLSLGCGRVGFDPIPKPEEPECVPTASRDTTCDGVDDDCNGRIDDGFKEKSTSCGVGACAGTRGKLTCKDGRERNSCDALAGAEPDDQCDGVDNDCDGEVDEDFTTMATTCGVGICTGNVGEATCLPGGMRVDSCEPLDGAGGDEASCDGVDNDCDGEVDEDYVPTQTFCGIGLCSSNTGELTCTADGSIVDTCDPLEGAASDDTTDDGLDDDCDGDIDEDVTCVGSTVTFGAGATTVAVPTNCTTVSVRLWGGAGSTAQSGGYWGLGLSRGDGGPGGYAAGVVAVDDTSTLTLHVGSGASDCDAPGTNAGNSSYAGGSGGVARGADGSPGEDGVVAGGGLGGAPGGALAGGNGGQGYFGGGGGGAGNSPGYPHGVGGAGGAASALLFDTGRIVAGGGGGGGGMGADLVTSAGQSGGDAGSGCGVDGEVETNTGGAGGGGGMCEVVGAASPDMQAGTDTLPYDPGGDLPGSTAVGGAGDGDEDANCLPGGDGYAILTFSP